MPENIPVSSLYFNLNTNSEKFILNGLTSKEIGKIVLHTYKDHEGKTSMQEILLPLEVENPRFQEGGMHWMLFQSQKPFRRGEVFSFELWIEGKPNIHFEAKVKDE